MRSRPRPVRPAPPSPLPPRRPPPPEILATKLESTNIDTNNEEDTSELLNIPKPAPVVIADQPASDVTSDTFDLFANFPPPPSKMTPQPAEAKESNVNLLFPEDDTFGEFLSGVSSGEPTAPQVKQTKPAGFSDIFGGGGGSSSTADFGFDPFGLAAPSKSEDSSLLTPNVMSGSAKNLAGTNGEYFLFA